jgi:hypothetical protein
MMKKIALALVLALAMTAAAPVVSAEAEMPPCFPCEAN